MNSSLESLLSTYPELYVQQRKELVEIVVDWETKNKYAILSPQKDQVGFIAERTAGLAGHLKRLIFRSHRPLEVDVFDRMRQTVMHLSRPFFFLFSDLTVSTSDGQKLGSLHRRFGIIHKRYDLHDEHGRVFATISSPLWRLWHFPVLGPDGQERASISKRWGGALREIFTDADTYRIQFGHQGWTLAQRAVLLAAAISVDLDFFENNQGSRGLARSWGD